MGLLKISLTDAISSFNVRSYGLISPPRVRALERRLKEKGIQISKSNALVSSSDEASDSNDNEVKGNCQNEASVTDRVSRFDEIFSSTTELTGILAKPPADYSKYLTIWKQKFFNEQDEKQNTEERFTITHIRNYLESNASKNSNDHKLKIKENRK